MKKIAVLFPALGMLLCLAACGGAPGETALPMAGGEPTETTAETSIAGTYTFEESAMNGAFVVPWTLVLEDDGTYQIIEDNPFMGRKTYEGTYTVEGDTVITGAFEGDPPQAAFFENDKSCKWTLDGGSCTPVNYDPDAAPNLGGGLPSLGEDIADAAGEDSITGIAYAADSAAQVCDIHLPEGEGPFPVIVLVHGGGFLFGDQAMPILQPVIRAANAHGYAVVSVDYRKSSEAVFPAALADVKAAVRFVRANAADYGFDAGRIAVWGESAGAYLSLMTALTPNVEALNGGVSDNSGISSEVTALVSFYAPVEFYTMYDEAGNPDGAAASFESKFLGQDISADETTAYTTYWETYAGQIPGDLKVWIQAGDADQRVPCTQSENFAARIVNYIGSANVEFSLIPGAGHEDDAFYTDENLNAVFAWLDGFMKS